MKKVFTALSIALLTMAMIGALGCGKSKISQDENVIQDGATLITPLWQQGGYGSHNSKFAIDESKGRIYTDWCCALDIDSGDVIWEYQLEGGISGPIVNFITPSGYFFFAEDTYRTSAQSAVDYPATISVLGPDGNVLFKNTPLGFPPNAATTMQVTAENERESPENSISVSGISKECVPENGSYIFSYMVWDLNYNEGYGQNPPDGIGEKILFFLRNQDGGYSGVSWFWQGEGACEGLGGADPKTVNISRDGQLIAVGNNVRKVQDSQRGPSLDSHKA